MRVWVTGAKGLVGENLVQELKRRQIEVVGTCHSECDVTDRQALEKAFEKIAPTHLINCAAFTQVDQAELEPQAALLLNAQAPELMAQIAQRQGARFIHLSTDYVFSGKDRTTPYHESDACDPVNVYGMSKWEGEKRVLCAMPSACIVRTSWIVAPKRNNFLLTILHRLQTHRCVEMVSDQVGQPTYCDDLVGALITLLDHQGIIHFSNTGAVSRVEVAEKLWQLMRKKNVPMCCENIVAVPSSFFMTRATRPCYSVLDTGLYTQSTGHPPRPFLEVMEEFLDGALSL